MGKLVWVPASVLMGGVFAFTDEVSAPWFAPAGTTRGGIPNVIKVDNFLFVKCLSRLSHHKA
jgi:hypothetical protein